MILTEENVLLSLKKVDDPDFKKDLVTLNMIKNIVIGNNQLQFTIELTTPACPLKEKLETDCRNVILEDFGAIREMRLDAFSERFAAAGIATLAFTYRYFGDSGGMPRQLMSVKRQLQDWDAALDFVKNCTDVDGSRVAVWGVHDGWAARRGGNRYHHGLTTQHTGDHVF